MIAGRWLCARAGFVMSFAASVAGPRIGGCAEPGAESAKLVEETRPALVVLVSVDRHGKAKSFGTRFFVSQDGILVTARHVAQAEEGLVALTQNGIKHPVTGFIGEDSAC